MIFTNEILYIYAPNYKGIRMIIKKSISFNGNKVVTVTENGKTTINPVSEDGVSTSELPTNIRKLVIAYSIPVLCLVIPIMILNSPMFHQAAKMWALMHLTETIVINIIFSFLFIWGIFRLGEWAGRYPAIAGVPIISQTELMAKIKNIPLNSPIEIVDLGNNKLKIKWNYADEKFIYLFGLGKIKNTYELLLKFSEKSHQVFANETRSRLSVSAGGLIKPSVSFKYSYFKGINPFIYEFSSGYGFVVKDGEIVFDKLYQYKFNPYEMKSLIITLITNNGWGYSPKVNL